MRWRRHSPRRLEGKQLLVLLDSAEHLLPEIAGEVAALTASCATLTLLVTSRERLQVAAENVWPVPVLAAHQAEQFVSAPGSVGVTLTPDETIVELCAQLDELPLAVELAAARTVLFSPDQLLERLTQRLDLFKGARDADPRQQTLRATIDWSYELLTAEEQLVFGKLSVFVSGCTFEAAEEVADADPDTLQSLLDKNLIRRRDTEDGPRFWMLETIRSYAVEKLELRDDAYETRRRHAEWCRQLARERLEIPGLSTKPASQAQVAGFRAEYDSARDALAWAWAVGQDELGIDLGVAYAPYWQGEGLFRDASSWLDEASGRLDATTGRARLKALKVAGEIAYFVRGDGEQADEFWAEAGAVAEELQLGDESAWVDENRAFVAGERGDVDGEIAAHERLLAYHRATGDLLGEAGSLHALAGSLMDVGEFERAEHYFSEAETIYRQLDPALSTVRLADNTHSRGDLALARGDHDSAILLYRDVMNSGAANKQLQACCLAGIASAMAASGKDEDAAIVWGSVCAAEETSGFRVVGTDRRHYEAHLARLEQSNAWNSRSVAPHSTKLPPRSNLSTKALLASDQPHFKRSGPPHHLTFTPLMAV